MSAHEADIEVLAEDECRKLIASGHFGRLGIVVDGRPQIFPVNYVFAEGVVVIRTAQGLKIERSPMTDVAFEIDAVDEATRTAWSVLAQGTAHDITNALDSRSERLRHMRVKPWPPGERDHWMAVYVHRLSGRRFKLETQSLVET